MVSYCMPRGRFRIKPPNFRQLRQKHRTSQCFAKIDNCSVFSAIEWQLNKQNCIKNRILHTATQFQSKIYSLLPLRLRYVRYWGWLASCYILESMRLTRMIVITIDSDAT
ncbi:uncharacterized protein LOC119639029 [Glossina fuscipes]|uniref:Uncharacterized protein LOC119639029 n=1 Tax=Glossina fuscipes TaxID=7396 RepID=A0A9C6DXC2_9MUSC|nr:uncharacterized protein LOC119639029 [Glossina fuscipes]